MRFLFCLLMLVLLTACQTNPSQSTSSAQSSASSGQASANEDTTEIVNAILNQKMKQNGPKLLCSQSAYNACYQINETQCLSEVGSFHDICLQKTVAKHGELQVGLNEREYGRYYSLCLMINHVVLHQDRSKEVLACIKNIKYNKQEGTGALLE